MTHEFKTPISTISIIQQVISDPKIVDTPERLSAYADIIGVEAKRLNEQVEKVLNIAKIEKGQFTLNKDNISVHELLEQLQNQCKARYELEYMAEINLDLKASKDIIFADQVHFSNILFNVVDNGVKYGGKPPVINIETYNLHQKLVITIKDNGIGIDKKDMGKIFQKFYRVPTGNIHNVKGFGLGLYYVGKIIDAHKYKIKVESEINNGTTFIIEIPQ
jgi:two-component system phosphate regulon sensor histidine kinase PhoR